MCDNLTETMLSYIFIYLCVATPNSPRRANAKGEDTLEARTHTGTDKKKGQKGGDKKRKQKKTERRKAVEKIENNKGEEKGGRRENGRGSLSNQEGRRETT